jgi:lipopolysaccharide/colanic/teichoic acid biosynthesis glycosyltransferase
MTSGTLNVEKMGNYVLLTQETREISPIQIFLKRMLDLVGGIVGSLFAVIIMIIVGPIIKMKSSGPIIFAQDRIGKNGKTFKMYKIRSMYMDAEEKKAALMSQNKMNGLMFKMDDDPRIIGSEKKDENGKPKGIGNFIRNTSLDEFPQFFNVLKGDMSLVGTRPPTVDEWNQYIPEYRKRLSMRPGITGLWQISGRSDITNFEDIVKLDAEYIDTWTVGTDLKIIMKTIGKVLKKEGAE